MDTSDHEKGVLEFIFDCNRRDKLMVGYLRNESWTPVFGSLVVCGVRPPRGNAIPETGIGIDGADLDSSSKRLRNARNLLANWHDEFTESGGTPPTELAPSNFIAWCIDSGYVTDWLRLIGSLCACDIEPGISLAHGGISDAERITILPPKLMTALVETAKSTPVLLQTIGHAIAPPALQNVSSNHSSLAQTIEPNPNLPLCNKKNRTPLDRVIDQAIRQAEEPDNYLSVWAELTKLALDNNRPFPLLGFSEREVKYQSDNESGNVDYLSKPALKERLKRNRERNSSKSGKNTVHK